MDIILIGQANTKRSDFFREAAEGLGHNLKVVDWKNWSEEELKEADVIKIDPPTHKESRVEELPNILNTYNDNLERLQNIQGINYINSPIAIKTTLDKIRCKEILLKNHVNTTPMISERIKNHEELVSYMDKNKISGVFIKPRYGSGAAGIIAYRYNGRTKDEIAYTSMVLQKDLEFCNTKNMRKLRKKEEIHPIIDLILKQEVIIENWVQKSNYKGLSYDIRVVYQYGKIDFILARGSKGPITNLHLNNCAINIKEIGLSIETIGELERLCHKTMECFPGLNIAGIDVLMTPKGKLMVIEVNGQGDLIYQDIFNENKIYKSQIIGGNKYGKFKG